MAGPSENGSEKKGKGSALGFVKSFIKEDSKILKEDKNSGLGTKVINKAAKITAGVPIKLAKTVVRSPEHVKAALDHPVTKVTVGALAPEALPFLNTASNGLGAYNKVKGARKGNYGTVKDAAQKTDAAKTSEIAKKRQQQAIDAKNNASKVLNELPSVS